MLIETFKQRLEHGRVAVQTLKLRWIERSLRQRRDDRCICCGLHATHYILTGRKPIPMCMAHAADVSASQVVVTGIPDTRCSHRPAA